MSSKQKDSLVIPLSTSAFAKLPALVLGGIITFLIMAALGYFLIDRPNQVVGSAVESQIPALNLQVMPRLSVSGQPIAPYPVVKALDRDGNGVGGVLIKSRLRSGFFVEGSVTEEVTDENGLATFSALVIEHAESANVVEFSADGFGEASTKEFNVRFGPPRKMSVLNEPLDSVVGQVIEGSPSVLVTDLAGNPVRGVNVMVSAKTAEPLALEGSKVAQTDNAGIAIFADLVSRNPASHCQLHFDPAVAGVKPVTSQTFNINSRP